MSETKKSEKVVSVKDVKQEKANQSKSNRANGGSDVIVDVLATFKIEFTKDFGKMKKGDTARVSQLAYEVYQKNGVIKKID